MNDLPKPAARIYALGEMEGWRVRTHIHMGTIPLRKKIYRQSTALTFSKKDHYDVAATWLTDEEGKVSTNGCYVAVFLGGFKQALAHRLPTQKDLLMYLAGDTSPEEMREFLLERWIKPDVEIVAKTACHGCTMCQKDYKKKLKAGAADEREKGSPRRVTG